MGLLVNLAYLNIGKSCLGFFDLGKEEAESKFVLLICNGKHFPVSNELTGKLPTEVGYLTNLVNLHIGKSCQRFLYQGGRKLRLNQFFCSTTILRLESIDRETAHGGGTVIEPSQLGYR
jgi:hypothetical protein